MTPDDVDLLDCERLVSDSAELIYRQIAPHMLIDGGKVASTAFGPNRSDNNMPSYSRSTLVSAQGARDWNTRNAASPSLGVWAVAVGEVSSADSRVVDDNDCPWKKGRKGLRATAMSTSVVCHARSGRSFARVCICTQ